jgi:hypothetical protein
MKRLTLRLYSDGHSLDGLGLVGKGLLDGTDQCSVAGNASKFMLPGTKIYVIICARNTSRYIYHYKSTFVDVHFKNVLYDVCTVQYGDPISCFQSAPLLSGQESYTVKKVIDFPVPGRDATNQTVTGRE